MGADFMNAVVMKQYGDGGVLRVEEVARPAPGEHEVLVRVAAAGVNPLDWLVRAGYLKERIPYEFPLIVGSDVAGVIAATGPKSSRFQAGDAVFGLQNIMKLGGYAEYVTFHEEDLAPKPASLSFVEAASVPMAALTSWNALIRLGDIQAGERVLIHAGAGGIGTFAIQLAKAMGALAITTASERNHPFLKDLGADQVIDYQKEDFAAALSEPVDLALDTVGGEVLRKSFDAVKPGGKLVSLVQQPDGELAKARGVQAHYVFVQPDGQRLGELGRWIDEGKIKTVVRHTLPLAQAAKAHQQSETRHTAGKIVLEVAKL